MPNAHVEASALLRILQAKAISAEEIRALIGLTEDDLHVLAKMMAEAPEIARKIASAIAFREKVLIEFERLVAQLPVHLRYT